MYMYMHFKCTCMHPYQSIWTKIHILSSSEDFYLCIFKWKIAMYNSDGYKHGIKTIEPTRTHAYVHVHVRRKYMYMYAFMHRNMHENKTNTN